MIENVTQNKNVYARDKSIFVIMHSVMTGYRRPTKVGTS